MREDTPQGPGERDWSDWLDAVFNGEVVLTQAAPTMELHQKLIDAYLRLAPTDRTRFANAVHVVFEHTPMIVSNAERIYYLLHLIAYVKPRKTRDYLKRFMYNELLRPIEFGGQSLHALLLLALAAYDVGEDVVEYVERSARQSPDASYLIICMRVVSRADPARTLGLLATTVQRIDGPPQAAALARYLKGFTSMYGYRGLYAWWTRHARELRSGDRTVGARFEMFEKALLAKFVVDPKLDEVPLAELDRMLFSALVLAARRPLSPEEVMAVAQACDQGDDAGRAAFDDVYLQQASRGWDISVERNWRRTARMSADEALLMTAAGAIFIDETKERLAEMILRTQTRTFPDIMDQARFLRNTVTTREATGH